MIQLLEISITMLIVMLGTKVSDFYQPDIMELHLLNGNISNIKIDKNQNYSCPIYCSANHYHTALIRKNKINDLAYSISYEHINGKSDVFLNGVSVSDIFIVQKLKNKNNKRKNKNIIITNKEKIELKNFIEIYR